MALKEQAHSNTLKQLTQNYTDSISALRAQATQLQEEKHVLQRTPGKPLLLAASEDNPFSPEHTLDPHATEKEDLSSSQHTLSHPPNDALLPITYDLDALEQIALDCLNTT